MASTRLTRSITGSNAKKATLSFWIKRGALGGSAYVVFTNRIDASNDTLVRFTSDLIDFKDYQSGSNVGRLETTQVFRDTSAWYHIVISIDTTLGTADDRQKMYVNGEQITSFASRTNYAQDTVLNINKTGTMEIGANNGADYFDGLMSYMAVVDGTAYDASYFGETNAATGIWKIKTSPSVTYGTNGCFLKMDTTSPGSDTSGNDNTFTASGTPTLAQDNASNNFTTLNPLNAYYTNSTFSNGNTTFASGSSYSGTTANILLSTGKWYWEGKPISKDGDGDNYVFGIQGQEATGTNQFVGSQAFGWMYYGASGQLYNNNSGASYGDTFTAGDIIGVALDCTNNKLYFSKNGVFQNSENPSAGTGGISITAPASVSLGGYYPSQTFWTGNSGTFSMNFGNGFFGVTAVASSNADAAGHGLFEYAVPTGYFTLNTKNLNTYGG
jgi:hypothetical protein